MGTKLAPRAYDAVKLIEESSFKQRAKKLELIEERGFSLIIYWNQIEAALKLIRYFDCIKDDWPNELNSRWRIFQHLKTDNPEKYNLVLGTSRSLWKTRNGIAHEGRNVPVDEYNKYVEAALWAIARLMREVPNLERLREKKRRSDAQVARISK